MFAHRIDEWGLFIRREEKLRSNFTGGQTAVGWYNGVRDEIVKSFSKDTETCAQTWTLELVFFVWEKNFAVLAVSSFGW